MAANLQRKQKNLDIPTEDAALINYLQKLYGDKVDFDGLTTNVLKDCNFFRSPPVNMSHDFLKSNEGLGGWGKRC